jgi:hypothetical protein
VTARCHTEPVCLSRRPTAEPLARRACQMIRCPRLARDNRHLLRCMPRLGGSCHSSSLENVRDRRKTGRVANKVASRRRVAKSVREYVCSLLTGTKLHFDPQARNECGFVSRTASARHQPAGTHLTYGGPENDDQFSLPWAEYTQASPWQGSRGVVGGTSPLSKGGRRLGLDEQVAFRVSYSWSRDQLQLTRKATCS